MLNRKSIHISFFTVKPERFLCLLSTIILVLLLLLRFLGASTCESIDDSFAMFIDLKFINKVPSAYLLYLEFSLMCLRWFKFPLFQYTQKVKFQIMWRNRSQCIVIIAFFNCAKFNEKNGIWEYLKSLLTTDLFFSLLIKQKQVHWWFWLMSHFI